MSIISTPRMVHRRSRAVLAGTALGALLLVGGAGIGCAASSGHGNATPQKTVTKTAAPSQQAQPSTSAPTSNPVPGVAHPAPPARNPAPVTHGSGQGGQGAPTSNPGSSGSGTVGPASVDGSSTGGTSNPADGSATGGTSNPVADGTGGYDPSTSAASATGGYDPSTSAASGYTAPTDNGTTAATAPDTTPQPNMDAYHAYDQQSWDAWKASSDAANAGDPAAAYAYNQASINSTANANAAYSGTPDTSAVAPDTSPVAPSGE